MQRFPKKSRTHVASTGYDNADFALNMWPAKAVHQAGAVAEKFRVVRRKTPVQVIQFQRPQHKVRTHRNVESNPGLHRKGRAAGISAPAHMHHPDQNLRKPGYPPLRMLAVPPADQISAHVQSQPGAAHITLPDVARFCHRSPVGMHGCRQPQM